MKLTPAINDFINAHLHDPIDQLVFKIRKQFDMAPEFIIDQINGRKKVAGKIPSWSENDQLVFPSVVSFEQCSSEITAVYKSSLVGGKYLVDLTGGFGVDTFFMSKEFMSVQYYERNEELANIVQHNYQELGVKNITVRSGNGIEFFKNEKRQLDWIFLDPARRGDQKQRVFLMEDCEPDIVSLADLLLEKSKRVLVKLSPMLDLEEIARKVNGVSEIIVVAVQNECKEVLVILSHQKIEFDHLKIKAVDLRKDGTIREFTSNFKAQKTAAIGYEEPLDFIYEPNRAILKAGLQNHLAQGFNLKKIAANSHFYTATDENLSFLGRVFRKIAVIKPKKQFLSAYLSAGKANIIARNYPLNAARLYQQFKITPGGDRYILATTLANKKKVFIICERLV